MRTSDLNYHLPPERIAIAPAEPRDSSRLLVVQPTGISHHIFREIGQFLHSGDLLVVNNTRVLPAKLLLRRPTGGLVAGLFLRELEPGLWEVMLRTRGRGKSGQGLAAEDYTFQLEERLGEGLWHLRVTPAYPAATVLDAIGHVPLPPYISRQRKNSGQVEETPADRQWYQTVFARVREHAGSVAAPTAGLHFTPDLLQRLTRQGVQFANVDLEVGLGTFLPVEAETLEEHPMHTERFQIPAVTVAALRSARLENRRIVTVGTTAVRTLEAAADQILDSSIPPHDLDSQTNLLIAPGYRFRLTDALVTNFHLPKSTLMALVAAYLGIDGLTRLKALYAEAIQQGYRFYSYGDAMFILPEARGGVRDNNI